MSWTVSNLQRPLREDVSLEISGIIAEKNHKYLGVVLSALTGRKKRRPFSISKRALEDMTAMEAAPQLKAGGLDGGCEMSRTGSPSRHTSRERHIRTGSAYRLTEKRRQSGFKNRQRPEILAPHTRWANCCGRRSGSRRPFTFKAVGRNGKRRISSYFCVKSCVSISVIVMCER